MRKPTVFISYSHRDMAWKDMLATQLDGLGDQEWLCAWRDDDIRSGEWIDSTIMEAMTHARIAVLLVTENFLASEYIREKEWPFLQKRMETEGFEVLPVLIEPSVWRTWDNLKGIKTFPENEIPIASIKDEQEQKALLAKCATLIASIVRAPAGTSEERKQALEELKSKLCFLFSAFSSEVRKTEESLDHYEMVVEIRGGPHVLVWVMVGEVSKSEIEALSRKIKDGLNEGWLVSTRPVNEVTERVASALNIKCFTLDDVICRVAGLDSYFERLISEMVRLGVIAEPDRARPNAIRLPCDALRYNVETDTVAVQGNYEEISDYVDRWVDDETSEQISVIGEFGTGKTWFAYRYAEKLIEEYNEAKNRRRPRPRLPLLIPLRNYYATMGVENLFTQALGDRFRGNKDAVRCVQTIGRFLVIFDGFDEATRCLDPVESKVSGNPRELLRERGRRNFKALTDTLAPGAKVILTGRTEQLPCIEDACRLFSGTSAFGYPRFEVLQLTELEKDRVEAHLRQASVHECVVSAITKDDEIRRWAGRPLMLSHIIDASEMVRIDLENGKPLHMARVLLHVVRARMTKVADSTGVSIPRQLHALCDLAWDMLLNTLMEIRYGDLPRILNDDESLLLQMEGHHLLIHDNSGNYAFAHRSLGEFFAAYKFVAVLGMLDSDFVALASSGETRSDDASARHSWRAHFSRSGMSDISDFEPDAESIKTRRGHAVDLLSPNALSLAAGMVSLKGDKLNLLTTLCWERNLKLAWDAINLLAFLEGGVSRDSANQLASRKGDEPLGSGIAWVLGELRTPGDNDCVLKALSGTMSYFRTHGTIDTPAWAWWDSAFALEKIRSVSNVDVISPGDYAVELLSRELPAEFSKMDLDDAMRHWRAVINDELEVSRFVVVSILKNNLNAASLYNEVLKALDFENDVKRWRVYYAVWVCGHRDVVESIPMIVKATENPLSSVRNCACEALGKLSRHLATDSVDRYSAVRALEKRLRDQYYRTRYHASWALAELESDDSASLLNTAIRYENVRYVRRHLENTLQYLTTRPRPPRVRKV